jgi:hypothetical protein
VHRQIGAGQPQALPPIFVTVTAENTLSRTFPDIDAVMAIIVGHFHEITSDMSLLRQSPEIAVV